MDYDFEINDTTPTTIAEPAISMDYYRTLSFLRKHNLNSTVEDAIPLKEGFDILRSKIAAKYSEKADSLIS